MTRRHELLEALASTIDDLHRFEAKIEPHFGELDLVNEGWSAADVINHLLTVEFAYQSRFHQIVTTSEPDLELIPDGMLALYTPSTAHDLIEQFAKERQKTVGYLHRLNPGDWQKRAKHPEKGVQTLRTFAHDLVIHDIDHTNQLAMLIAQNRRSSNGDGLTPSITGRNGPDNQFPANQPINSQGVAYILCGALGHEVRAIIDRHDWDVTLFGIPASVHMRPEQIAPAVEARLRNIRKNHANVLVVFGDCGSQGALDKLLDRLNIDRISGPHCYEFYAGEGVNIALEEQPGTFFLTDYLIRTFEATVWRGLGLDRYPELQSDYFGNYSRIVYLAQTEDEALDLKGHAIAERLGLAYEKQTTGFGNLESRLVAWMSENALQVVATDAQ